MRIQTITAFGVILIGLGMTPVLAQNSPQNGPHIGGWPTPAERQQLMREPGYSVGTGAAHVGGTSNPSNTKAVKPLTTRPGYRGRTRTAQTTKK